MTNEARPTACETRPDDILAARDLEAIVNPVNCLGTMGKGLARQFAARYPEILEPYQKACREHTLTVKSPQILIVNHHKMPRYVVNLATKIHWRNPARIEYIETGLDDMYQQLAELEISSVGIPPLGAGLGGLRWERVRPVIEKHAARHPDIRTCIYLPR